MRQITKRLKSGQDLKEELERMSSQENIKAGVVVSLVGSLTKAVLRIADGKTIKEWSKEFEIVSATGTVSVNGCHIHVSLADKEGTVIGGDLKSGCQINTTAETVILAFDDVEYNRMPDIETGYDELILD